MPPKYVRLKDRPEWKGFEPIALPATDEPVFSISYEARYKEILGYVFACIRNKEYSQRALDLTTEALHHNPAHYSFWKYRREILRHLKSDLIEETENVYQMMIDNPKNYQLWGHCHFLVQESANFDLEGCLAFLQLIFEDDSKNYHAWSFRQWLIIKFPNWPEELDFAAKMIHLDVRNNSAWNYRFFVIQNEGLSQEVVEREIKYTVEKIQVAPHNESSWVYLEGLLRETGADNSELHTFLASTSLDDNIFALKTRITLFMKGGKKEELQQAVQACTRLGAELDVFRMKYWIDFLLPQIEHKLSALI